MGAILNDPIESKIAGVDIYPLKQIADERGAVLHMLRSDDPYFTQFGEVYFSEVNPGQIKAWKKNKTKTQRFAVPHGRLRLVLFDGRQGSSTQGALQEVFLGRPEGYYLVCIPPMVWYGFQAVSEEPALLANCPDKPFSDEDTESLALNNEIFSYNWE